MTLHKFDDLILAFQWAFVAGREELRKRQEEALHRLCDEKEQTDSRSAYLVFSLPRAGKNADEYETVTLPLSSFRDRRRPQLSMLSVEFDCELTERKLPGSSREPVMVMKIRRTSGAKRNNWRRVRILFRSEGHPSGEVRIDGELLMEIPPFEGAMTAGKPVAVKRSFFRFLMDKWRKLWGLHEFWLTKEQARRLREIPNRSD